MSKYIIVTKFIYIIKSTTSAFGHLQQMFEIKEFIDES